MLTETETVKPKIFLAIIPNEKNNLNTQKTIITNLQYFNKKTVVS